MKAALLLRKPVGSRQTKFYMLRRKLKGWPGKLMAYGFGLLLVGLAVVLRLSLVGIIGAELALYPAFFLACAVAIRFTGVGPSLVTILASAWAVHYFFLPHGSQVWPEPAHFLFTGIFVVSNLLVLGLAQAMRRERDRAELNALAATEEAQARRENERRFHSLFENSPDAVFLSIPDGMIKAANPAACAMFGMSEEEICQKGRARLIDPADPRHEALMEERRRTGKAINREVTFIRKDGTRFPAEVSSVIVAGDPPRAFVIVRDISERKRAEEALLESQERFRIVAENAQAVFGIVQGKRFVWANPYLCQLSGYTLQEIVSMDFVDMVHPDFRALVSDYARRRQLGEPAPTHYEFAMVTKSGETRWMDFSPGPIEYQGRPAIVGTAYDVTERKRVEDALRHSEYRFRIMGETIDYGVWMCNKDGGKEYVSQSFLDLLNMTMEEMKQFGWTKRLVPEDVPGMMEKWLDCVRSGKLWDSEHRIIDRHGRIHTVLTRGKPVRDAEGNITSWVGINLDITERKKTEHALAEAKEQLRQYTENLERTVQERSRKLNELVEEMEHFSYAITHDMRAPLRTMHGLSKMLVSECKECLQGERRDVLRRIADAATRMDDLITDSLNYSKVAIQRLDLEPIDLKPLIQGVVESYPEFQPHKADITIDGDIPVVMGNKAGLTQCCSNLLSNGVKFVQPGIVPQIRVWAEPKAEWVRVNFQDNGIGIPKAYQEQIWNMFQVLSKGYEGTGIGLPLVRKIVYRMGGKVGLESEPGRGSCFWFELKRHIL